MHMPIELYDQIYLFPTLVYTKPIMYVIKLQENFKLCSFFILMKLNR